MTFAYVVVDRSAACGAAACCAAAVATVTIMVGPCPKPAAVISPQPDSYMGLCGTEVTPAADKYLLSNDTPRTLEVRPLPPAPPRPARAAT